MTGVGKRPEGGSLRQGGIGRHEAAAQTSEHYVPNRHLRDKGVMVRDEDAAPSHPAIVHIEKYWPVYISVAFAILASFVYIYEAFENGKIYDWEQRHVKSTVIAVVLAGLFSFAMMSILRSSLHNLHQARTTIFKSRSYGLGVAAGLCLFVYWTFISPQMVLGIEFGPQVAFKDGLQAEDAGAVALLILKAALYAVIGGTVFRFISKRLFADKT